jgi:hypothetical protein
MGTPVLLHAGAVRFKLDGVLDITDALSLAGKKISGYIAGYR